MRNGSRRKRVDGLTTKTTLRSFDGLLFFGARLLFVALTGSNFRFSGSRAVMTLLKSVVMDFRPSSNPEQDDGPSEKTEQSSKLESTLYPSASNSYHEHKRSKRKRDPTWICQSPSKASILKPTHHLRIPLPPTAAPLPSSQTSHNTETPNHTRRDHARCDRRDDSP